MIESLIGLVPSLAEFLRGASARKRLTDDRGHRAVEAILGSVNESRLYIVHLERGNSRDFEREGNLSRCWTQTAAALRGIDDDLARRAQLKGQYWTDPDHWDDHRTEEARIGLEEVARDAEALLSGEDAH